MQFDNMPNSSDAEHHCRALVSSWALSGHGPSYAIDWTPILWPSIQCEHLNVVLDTATCVSYALEGNIEGLIDLFDRGLASPKDVSSTRGYTLLRVRCFRESASCNTAYHLR